MPQEGNTAKEDIARCHTGQEWGTRDPRQQKRTVAIFASEQGRGCIGSISAEWGQASCSIRSDWCYGDKLPSRHFHSLCSKYTILIMLLVAMKNQAKDPG